MGEDIHRGNTGGEQGLIQKLTAREQTTMLFPSAVDVLCRGQSSSTRISSFITSFEVSTLENITPHRTVAVLQTHNTQSEGSQPLYCSLGSPGGAQASHQSCLWPLPLTDNTRRARPCRQLSYRVMQGLAPAEHPENCHRSGSWCWTGSKGWRASSHQSRRAPYLSHAGEQCSSVTTTSWGCSLARGPMLLASLCSGLLTDASHW